MRFSEYLEHLNETVEYIEFSNSEIEKLEKLKLKYDNETEEFKYQYYHTELIVRKIKDYYITILEGVSELYGKEKIYLQSKVHSVEQVSNVIRLCGELDALVKKFHYSYM